MRWMATAAAAIPTSILRKTYGDAATRSDRCSAATSARLAAADRDSTIAGGSSSFEHRAELPSPLGDLKDSLGVAGPAAEVLHVAARAQELIHLRLDRRPRAQVAVRRVVRRRGVRRRLGREAAVRL